MVILPRLRTNITPAERRFYYKLLSIKEQRLFVAHNYPGFWLTKTAKNIKILDLAKVMDCSSHRVGFVV